MPQTKFVLSKALAQGLKPIVIMNKVDRDTAVPNEVEDKIFDLFDLLGYAGAHSNSPPRHLVSRRRRVCVCVRGGA